MAVLLSFVVALCPASSQNRTQALHGKLTELGASLAGSLGCHLPSYPVVPDST